MPHAHDPEVNPQKTRTGLSRIFHAGGYSLQGLQAGWGETAFRQEALAAIVLVPLAFWLGRSWVETALLAGSVLIVMIV
ncbi:MAG: diacylglycerol kinase, partial [Burkholderiaceae bacterium]